MSVVARRELDLPGRTVLTTEPGGLWWTLAPIRIGDRLLARLHSETLDRQLAAGQPVDTDRLRAVRAAILVTPRHRHLVAAGWSGALTARPGLRAVPLQRGRIHAAAADIRDLIIALRAAQPVPARGVALAYLLLTDGSGPLYHGPSRRDLAAEVREAVSFLDPYTDL